MHWRLVFALRDVADIVHPCFRDDMTMVTYSYWMML